MADKTPRSSISIAISGVFGGMLDHKSQQFCCRTMQTGQPAVFHAFGRSCDGVVLARTTVLAQQSVLDGQYPGKADLSGPRQPDVPDFVHSHLQPSSEHIDGDLMIR